MNNYHDAGVPIPFIVIFISIVLCGFGVLITRPEPKPSTYISSETLIGKNVLWNGHKTFVIGHGLFGGYEVIITQDNGNAVRATADVTPLLNAYKATLSCE